MENEPQLEKLLSRRESAKLLSVSIDTVKELERQKKLNTIKLGRNIARIRYSELLALIEASRKN
jgi:excisionase family DNA binding protein